jgi:hypothetical protein
MIWRHGSSFALCLPALLLAQALVSDDEWLASYRAADAFLDRILMRKQPLP